MSRAAARQGALRKWRPGPRHFFSGSRVCLRLRQVYIVPTRSGLWFAVMLVVMLVAAINYKNSMAYGLTFLLGSLFWVAILHTWLNLVGLELSAAGAAPVHVGQQALFRIALSCQNKPRMAIALSWWDDQNGPAQAMGDVPRKDVRVLELACSTTARGRLRPGLVRVETRYPLGLLVAWSWVDLRQEVLVYPRPLAGSLPSAGGEHPDAWNGERGQRQDEGTDDYQGLREYQPGDLLRRLYWKAYSRGQGLQVKRFSSIDGEQRHLDYNALSGPAETRLSQLCYWVLKLSDDGQSFSLQLPGKIIPMGRSESHRDNCLWALALFEG